MAECTTSRTHYSTLLCSFDTVRAGPQCARAASSTSPSLSTEPEYLLHMLQELFIIRPSSFVPRDNFLNHPWRSCSRDSRISASIREPRSQVIAPCESPSRADTPSRSVIEAGPYSRISVQAENLRQLWKLDVDGVPARQRGEIWQSCF